MTVEFIVPYLNRKLSQDQKSGQIPKLPQGLVKPTIVAGINALGRGQDREALVTFITTISQTLGPEAALQFVNTEEYIKRLAASQGIDVLNLVKGMEELQAEKQQQMQMQQQMEMTKQAGSFAATEQKAIKDNDDTALRQQEIAAQTAQAAGQTGQETP